VAQRFGAAATFERGEHFESRTIGVTIAVEALFE
jgi:hypothetical protein